MTVEKQSFDVILVGGGIASITLATYLQELAPQLQLLLLEQGETLALESTDGWNNAGTGHAGYAELNYCPENPDGSVSTSRAVNIMEQFEISRQFWASQVKNQRLQDPKTFIHPTNHMAFVWGEANVEYMRRRHEALQKHPLFADMEFSADPEQIKNWAPLIMEGRDPNQPVAASHSSEGTDINFGELTLQLAAALGSRPNYQQRLQQRVIGFRQQADKSWDIEVMNLKTYQRYTVNAKFVFIGAGGASISLLQKSGIAEAKNYAGFPVGGQFLLIDKPALAARHPAKVYGKAEQGAPPMSVPHLDLRNLDGKQMLLFGPFALFSTKFLKRGSWLDFFKSIRLSNLGAILRVGWDNLHLIKYLVGQALLNDAARQREIAKYFPNVRREDWELITAGQRVQIIKKTAEGAKLQFGTEIVSSADKSFVTLMGASPGASTAPAIMLNVLRDAFATLYQQNHWEEKLAELIPSYGRKINEDPALVQQVRGYINKWLQLKA